MQNESTRYASSHEEKETRVSRAPTAATASALATPAGEGERTRIGVGVGPRRLWCQWGDEARQVLYGSVGAQRSACPGSSSFVMAVHTGREHEPLDLLGAQKDVGLEDQPHLPD